MNNYLGSVGLVYIYSVLIFTVKLTVKRMEKISRKACWGQQKKAPLPMQCFEIMYATHHHAIMYTRFSPFSNMHLTQSLQSLEEARKWPEIGNFGLNRKSISYTLFTYLLSLLTSQSAFLLTFINQRVNNEKMLSTLTEVYVVLLFFLFSYKVFSLEMDCARISLVISCTHSCLLESLILNFPQEF